MVEVQAWETEDYFVVFGTHDLLVAFDVSLGYFEEYGLEVPEDLLPALGSSLEYGGARWADPAVADIEDETPWPVEMLSIEAVEGWIPYFSVMWCFMSEMTREVRIEMIRSRQQARIDAGLIGGVQEWSEISFLLGLVDEMASEPVEYEYAVKRNSLVRPEMVFTVGDYWGDYEERLSVLGVFQKDSGRGSKIKYSLARRRKTDLEEELIEV